MTFSDCEHKPTTLANFLLNEFWNISIELSVWLFWYFNALFKSLPSVYTSAFPPQKNENLCNMLLFMKFKFHTSRFFHCVFIGFSEFPLNFPHISSGFPAQLFTLSGSQRKFSNLNFHFLFHSGKVFVQRSRLRARKKSFKQ